LRADSSDRKMLLEAPYKATSPTKSSNSHTKLSTKQS
jgi:hypothetical protein